MGASIDVIDGAPCTFDIGGRDLVIDHTLNVTGKLGVNFQGAIIVQNAANITITSSGKLKARGDFVEAISSFPLSGGDIELNADGNVSHDGLFDISGSTGGTLTINALGNVTFENRSEVRSNGIGPALEGQREGDGGTLLVTTGGDLVIDGDVTMTGQNQGEGGAVTVSVAGDLELLKNVYLTGGSGGGGEFDAFVGGDVLVERRLWVDAMVGDGEGGSIQVEAGGGIVAQAPARLSSVGHSAGELGGSGGSIDLIAIGSVTIDRGVSVKTSGGIKFDGEGGFLDIEAGSDVTFDGHYTSRSGDTEGFGGFFAVTAARDLSIGGSIDVRGKDGGGDVDGEAGRGVTLSGAISADALAAFGEGGAIFFEAGRLDDANGLGIVRVQQNILFRSGAGNGVHSPLTVSACGVTIEENVKLDGSGGVDAGGVMGGANLGFFTVRSAEVRANAELLAPPAGGITFTHPTGADPVIDGTATVNPAAMTLPNDDRSLYPECPVCGDDVVQSTEVCDKGPGAEGACCNADCSALLCTPTPTRTATPTPTLSGTPTLTITPTPGSGGTASPSATATPTTSGTLTPTVTATAAATPTTSGTLTPTVTATAAATPTTTGATPSRTPSGSPTPSATPAASATPTGSPTPTSATPAASATPTSSGTATPTATAPIPTPAATPDAFLHLFDPKTAKSAVKCQVEINKRAAKFLGKKLKSLAKCTGGAFKCIQTKTDDKRPACLTKAGVRCGKELARITKEESKLAAKIVSKCSGLGGDNLSSQAGLGYEALETQCQLGAVGDSTVDEVAACIVASYECQAETLFERHMPRAKELMAQSGVSQQDIDRFTCLGAHGGSGEGLGDPSGAGKAVRKCQDAITKASAKLAAAELKGQVKCLNKLYKCVQTKPGDTSCLSKGDRACDKEQARLRTIRAKLDTGIDRKCAALDFTAVIRPAFGVNVEALDAGAGETLDTLNKYEDAVRSQARCLSEVMLQVTMPRARQMLSLQDPPVAFPSAGCL